MINPHNYCKQQASNSGSSFYYSFLFLPPRQRQAIIAVYAFCREIDDIVDNCLNPEIAAKKLAFWQNEIAAVYAQRMTSCGEPVTQIVRTDDLVVPCSPDRRDSERHGCRETKPLPQHPVAKALQDIIQNYQLQQQHFVDMIQGMFMDLQYQGYQTFADLRLYCHRVASTVGMLAAEIFGYSDPRTLEYARLLGIAFQLVNIIRDIGEDARRGRIYLPEEDLAKFGVDPQHILNGSCEGSAAFLQLMQFQADRARQFYQKAIAALPAIDRRNQLSGLIMAKIYFTLLTEIEHSKFRVLRQKIRITPLRKLWLAWRTSRSERRRAAPAVYTTEN